MKKVLVVCNYSAGRKTAVLNKKVLRSFLLKNSEFFKIIDICDLNIVDVSEFDTVIAMGGDGTINKVLPFLINTSKTLGIIPCGTANLLSAKLGIPANIKKALKILEKENITKIDVLSVNDMPCVLRCGLGYDFDIIGKTPQSLKNKFGYFSYFIAGILFALRMSIKKYNFIIDNVENEINASCVIVANCANMYKNIVSVANKNDLDDGLMDVFVLKTDNPFVFFLEFLSILLNRKKDNTKACYFKTSNLKIKNKMTMCHIDGEKRKFSGDLEFKILQQAIKVYS